MNLPFLRKLLHSLSECKRFIIKVIQFKENLTYIFELRKKRGGLIDEKFI